MHLDKVADKSAEEIGQVRVKFKWRIIITEKIWEEI